MSEDYFVGLVHIVIHLRQSKMFPNLHLFMAKKTFKVLSQGNKKVKNDRNMLDDAKVVDSIWKRIQRRRNKDSTI